jgi:hypothetical protein
MIRKSLLEGTEATLDRLTGARKGNLEMKESVQKRSHLQGHRQDGTKRNPKRRAILLSACFPKERESSVVDHPLQLRKL